MNVQRFDYSDLKATKTDEGFLVDSPIVARVGIQEYRRADGTIRRELRLPDEVFSAEALASMKAKPITVDHPGSGRVDSKTAHRVTVGTILVEGRQDGDNVRTDIVIHSPDAIGERRELSLGYMAVLDETPGEWNGQRYDAIQRNIRINHLSVVKHGRAGVARLNLDSNEVEDFETSNQKEHQTMTVVKIKLDNGIEYDAAPEVSVALDKLRSDASAAATKLEKLEAERDTLKARVDGIQSELDKAKEQGRVDALARMKLEEVASKLKVDHADKTDRQIKEAVIRTVRKDAELSDKSDVYIDAAFDMAVEAVPEHNMADQRKSVHTHNDSGVKTSRDSYQAYMDSLSKKEEAK